MQATDRITRSYGKETSLGVVHLQCLVFVTCQAEELKGKDCSPFASNHVLHKPAERSMTLFPPEGPPGRECGTGGDLAAHSHHKLTNSLNAFSRLAPAFLSWKQEH